MAYFTYLIFVVNILAKKNVKRAIGYRVFVFIGKFPTVNYCCLLNGCESESYHYTLSSLNT